LKIGQGRRVCLLGPESARLEDRFVKRGMFAIRALMQPPRPGYTAAMSTLAEIQELEKRVLALPLKQRVFLAEALLGSLPPLGQELSDAEEMAEV
jgi:hypothetical protein